MSRAELPATSVGEYEGRSVDAAAGIRIAFESMPAHFPPDESPFKGLRPGHFVQTLEPVELIELSPVEEHDRTMAVVARNMAAVTS